MKIIVPTTTDSNLTIYMMVFMLLMTIVNLMKNTFNLGYFKYSDETKMEILLAIKAFFTVFTSLKYIKSLNIFDSDLDKAHDKSLERVNQTLELFGGKLNLPYEFTYTLVGMMAAILTFSTVRLNIRFSYYFYILTKNSS
jgi:hypothetical protein